MSIVSKQGVQRNTLSAKMAGAYHHGHLVQRRLAIEQHNVTILQMALHLVAKVQMAIIITLQVAQIKSLTVLTNDEASTRLTRRRIRPNVDELLQPVHRER